MEEKVKLQEVIDLVSSNYGIKEVYFYSQDKPKQLPLNQKKPLSLKTESTKPPL